MFLGSIKGIGNLGNNFTDLTLKLFYIQNILIFSHEKNLFNCNSLYDEICFFLLITIYAVLFMLINLI